jgi:hypothetical protein
MSAGFVAVSPLVNVAALEAADRLPLPEEPQAASVHAASAEASSDAHEAHRRAGGRAGPRGELLTPEA